MFVKRAFLCKIYVTKQGYFFARATSDRNEVSQHEEVRVWIPDGRSYMDVKQHSIQHFPFTVRAARLALSVRPNRAKYTLRSKVSFTQGELSSFKKCQDIFRLHGCKTTQHPALSIYSARSKTSVEREA